MKEKENVQHIAIDDFTKAYNGATHTLILSSWTVPLILGNIALYSS
jgi:hypothetical protein